VESGKPKELRPNRTAEDFGEEGRYRVAHLLLHGSPATKDDDIVRERLDTAELAHAQAAVGPMERTDRGPGLRLDRP